MRHPKCRLDAKVLTERLASANFEDVTDSLSAVGREEDSSGKRALLEAALRLFVRDGLSATTVRAVATEAGVTNPAIFKFFGGRDELARCVFERCYERLADALALGHSEGCFEERMSTLAQAAARFMEDDLDAFLFVTEETRRFWPTVRAGLRRRSILRGIERLFALGVEQGKVAPEHDLRLLVAATVGLFTQVGRALYFEELAGPALRRAPELARLILRIGR